MHKWPDWKIQQQMEILSLYTHEQTVILDTDMLFMSDVKLVGTFGKLGYVGNNKC